MVWPIKLGLLLIVSLVGLAIFRVSRLYKNDESSNGPGRDVSKESHALTSYIDDLIDEKKP